ncbi:MAG: HK97 family phage major capsid protein [Rhodococcus sp. (in: high G+C Gram-positive bacteria)]|jgi:HK97 family phage major capsid protein
MTRGKTLSLNEIRSELAELTVEARELIEDAKTEHRDLEDDEDDRLTEITERAAELRELETRAVEKQAHLRSLIADGATEAGTPWGDSNSTESRMFGSSASKPVTERDNAMRTIERGVKANELQPHSAEKLEALMENRDDGDLTAKWTIAAGSPHYRTAFAKLVGDSQRGHMLWTPEEQQAYRDVVGVARAMQIDTGTGSYALPISLDPAIALTNDGSSNPLRRIARVVQITGSEYRGISSAGVTSEWLPESQEAADASPVLVQPIIKAEKGAAFVPFSYEFQQDALGFMNQLGALLADGADQLQAEAFMLGSGTDEPRGLITALVAAGGSVIVSGTGEALNAADFYTVQNALGARYSAGAQWVMNLATLNGARQFETTSGAVKFPGLEANPPVLLGRTVNEASFVDGSINPAATESNYVAVYGDFAKGFTIVDRIGTTVELVQNLMGAARRPTGERGAFMTFRTGSDVVNTSALKVLRYNTTA